MLQQGLGSSLFSKSQPTESEFKGRASNEKPKSNKEERGWPSFRQLVDLSKLSLEALTSSFLQFILSRFRSDDTKRGLTPLKDHLRMPEDEVEQPQVVNRQSTHAPLTETRQVHTTRSTAEKYLEMKPPKVKSSTSKDPCLSSKHHSSKRQEYAEFYGSSENPPHSKSRARNKGQGIGNEKRVEKLFMVQLELSQAQLIMIIQSFTITI